MRRIILLCALFVICSSAAFAQEDKITQGVVTQTTNTTYTTVTHTKQVRMSDEEWAEYKRQKREERRAIRNGTADAATIQKFVDEKRWGVGLRIGGLSCLNLVGYYNVIQRGYAEARFGLSYSPYTETSADFTALYNWRIVNAEWTPKIGRSFIDLGVGINAGGSGYGAYVGAALMARIGINFYKVPMTLSFDYTPSIGLVKYYEDVYNPYLYFVKYKLFNDFGLINFGITCTYNF